MTIQHRSFLYPSLRLLFLFFVLTNTSYAKLPFVVSGNTIPSLADMLEKIMPAVVNISAEGRQIVYNPSANDPIYQHFFGRQLQHKKIKGSGSGIIIDNENGYIITNSHVVHHAEKITITLNDNRHLPARIVGQDPKADVAVLQVPTDYLLTAMPTGNSDQLRVGDFVVAIGNPYGIGQSVSSGIVSALGRNNLGIEAYENFIQTDAPINPGNSGGALVNLKGELIGINTAILGGDSGGNVGIGFAIPINMVLDIKKQLVQYGKVLRGQLGIMIQDLTQEIAQSLNAHLYQGALIVKVLPNSPAILSGLKKNDIIVAINNKPVLNSRDVRTYISTIRVGKKVNIQIIRKGMALKLTTMVSNLSGR